MTIRSTAVAVAVAATLTGGLTLAAVPAYAQMQPGAAAAGRHHFEQVLESLGLSDAQKTQIRDIMKGAREKAQSATDPQARRQIMMGTRAQIRDVLTPDQRAKFDAQMKAWRGQHQQGGAQ